MSGRTDAAVADSTRPVGDGAGPTGSGTGVPLYYSRLRREIIRFVPTDARRVLSVGCGAGRTEGELVKRGCRVVGVELSPEAAAMAREAGLEVLLGDTCTIEPPGEAGEYDCLIYADILEHLVDPLAVLRRHIGLLRAGGTLIISVPNFRHHRVLWQLFVRGRIRYVDAGVLDRTHVRLTTRRMVVDWMTEVGVEPAETKYNMSMRRERLLARCSGGLLREFLSAQVVLAGVKRDGVESGRP